MHRLAPLAVLCALTACRCTPPPINMVEAGFRIEETELDFGPVLEGQVVIKPVHVVSTSVAGLSLTLTADLPFAVQGTLDLEGGSNVPVDVKFLAGSTQVMGTLTVSSPGGDVTVTLKGTGVHPLDCLPSAPCRESHFVLETNSCSESVMVDGTDCTPTSTCLERGQCLGGLCQGVARTCDDNNKCTIDGCAEGIGCVNAVNSCPPPTALCRVATCDPGSGCGEAQAPDGTPCGAVDCVSAHLCAAGQCRTVSTPDGFPCSPPTPCQGGGTCQQQVCKRPDAGVMVPELVLPLGGSAPASRPMLLSYAGQLFGEVCGLALPLVPLDGGTSSDGGALDGGFADGGHGCGLFSYTNNGFERFTQPFGDERERAFLHVGNLGAALLDDGGLELRSLATGQLAVQLSLPGSVSPKGVANAPRGEPWLLLSLPDGGAASSDGGAAGLSRLVRLGDGGALEAVTADLDAKVSLLALDEQGNAWLSGSDVAGYIAFDDAGTAAPPRWSSIAPPLTTTLATGGGFAFVGSTQFIASAYDGGVIMNPSWLDDAGQPLKVQERMSLVSSERAFVFYRHCTAPISCPADDEELRLRELSLSTGEVLDDARLSPSFGDPRVVEATLLELAGYPPGVAALIQLHRDGGAAAYLQLTVGSAGDLTCPLPEASDVAAAAIGSGYLWAYVNRDGGAYALEAYPLTGLPLSTTAWPLADGIAGQRRAR
jgi:hypothetical protein